MSIEGNKAPVSFEVNKAQAWAGLIVLLVTLIVSFANLFTASNSHENRITKLEANEEKRSAEQKARDEAQAKRDAELQQKLNQRDAELQQNLTKRDAELQTTLGKISESVNFANWNIGAIQKQMEKAKR